jgi:hypothetical protein
VEVVVTYALVSFTLAMKIIAVCVVGLVATLIITRSKGK